MVLSKSRQLKSRKSSKSSKAKNLHSKKTKKFGKMRGGAGSKQPDPENIFGFEGDPYVPSLKVTPEYKSGAHHGNGQTSMHANKRNLQSIDNVQAFIEKRKKKYAHLQEVNINPNLKDSFLAKTARSHQTQSRAPG